MKGSNGNKLGIMEMGRRSRTEIGRGEERRMTGNIEKRTCKESSYAPGLTTLVPRSVKHQPPVSAKQILREKG